MIKRLSSITLMSLCTVLLTTSVCANESKEQSKEKTTEEHVPVGSRAEGKEDALAHEKERADMEAKGLNEDGTPAHAKKNSAKKVVKNAKKGLNAVAGVYYTSHNGAYHNAIAISALGDNITLEDGSLWVISPSDNYATLNWLATDLIVITPNRSWFSSYNYRLTNQNTGASIAVNMYLGPVYNGTKTHWITAIDYSNNVLFLEDGTIWNMSSYDNGIIRKWALNDTVVIGINDGWLSSTRPNILINVNMANFAAGIAK